MKLSAPSKLFLIILLILTNHAVYSQLQSPEAYLGYELGTAFTRHHKVVDYFKHVASESGNVTYDEYGMTYEKRPLTLAIVSSQSNMQRLEELRKNNLGLLSDDNQNATNPIAIVWLSYNVHGNESVSTEAAMATIHALADKSNQKTQAWLNNTIVIIDPCINPDGRERYVNWYYQYGNKVYNPDPNSKEHHEPWPNGRANHYLFDLNRDWAWLSQIESQQRINVYNQWLPHVHVDFHEQGVNSPYFFAPAAEPLHEVITDWQREFQIAIGKNHAKYFDENGWLYFTKEVFDLLYPSYGDTYPTYNGAIGMTYEQGGSGRAGLGVLTNEGDTLTLKQRIAHHYTTGLSTIEITSNSADKVVNEFQKYFQEAKNQPQSKYKSYIVSLKNNKDKINSLIAFLNNHNIDFGFSSSQRTLKGFSYIDDQDKSFIMNNNDLVISAYQPKSRLVQSLFEPEPRLSDSITYDITAWAIPYSFGLEAYATTEKVTVTKSDIKALTQDFKTEPVDKAYAFLTKWESLNDVKWLSYLLKQGVLVRFATERFQIGQNSFDPGTLIITKRGNEHLGDNFENLIQNAASMFERKIYPAKTGFVSKGKDFGSGSVRYLRQPKIAILSGKSISSLAFGEIWHFFEQQIDFPVTVLDTKYFSSVDLSSYDVLILPSGAYGSLISEDKRNELASWVKFGGKLVVMESALNAFIDKKPFGLKAYASSVEKEEIENATKSSDELSRFGDRERDAIKDAIFGSIFKTKLDNSHPLAFGYDNHYFTLKRSSRRLAFLAEDWNVSTIENKGDNVSGFSGSNALNKVNRSLVYGVEDMGRGSIVYMNDNPLFRSFWQNGKLLFSNAVFLVGQ